MHGNDHFIVAASDGVYDVMSNEEVIDFIESNRRLCVKDVV
jgi:serine/threonine protein phosphatase PrpC